MLFGTVTHPQLADPHQHRRRLGIHFAGIGSASRLRRRVALDATVLDWRQQWFALTALGVLHAGAGAALAAPPDTIGVTRSGEKLEDNPPSPLFLRLFLAAYSARRRYVVSATSSSPSSTVCPVSPAAARWSSLR
jgi:hypothetical protein